MKPEHERCLPELADGTEIRRAEFERRAYLIRDQLVSAMEELEVAFANVNNPWAVDLDADVNFCKTPWVRESGGGGQSGVLRGRVFEKACVHVSTVHGTLSEDFRGNIPGADVDGDFWACGVSVIAHPWHPHAPTAHMNVRRIETTRGWFGGGADLTPMLDSRRERNDGDARLFHAEFSSLFDRHPEVSSDYDTCRKWCDEYFFLPHRESIRGVGGVFFDYHASPEFDADVDFLADLGRTFSRAYLRIVSENLTRECTDAERAEQARWRGRYAEFNLLYDRGTKFGLKTGGNPDTILSSLPPTASWR